MLWWETQQSKTYRNERGQCYWSKTTAGCYWKKQKPEIIQEREVFTMRVQGTRKKLNGLRSLHRMGQTAASKIFDSEL